jgi:hypothetical protein
MRAEMLRRVMKEEDHRRSEQKRKDTAQVL